MKIFYVIAIFIILIIIALLLTSIEIDVQNIEFSTDNISKLRYKLSIKIKGLFNITYFKFNITKKRFDKMFPKEKRMKMKKRFFSDIKAYDIKKIKILKKLDVDIKKLNLNVYIGLENAGNTAIFTALMYSVISILIRNKMQKSKENKYKFTPIYQGKNVLSINLKCILNIKMIHIINVIYLLCTLGKDCDKNGTSNRRIYAYSHEQYKRYG